MFLRDETSEMSLREMLMQWIGRNCEIESSWLADAIQAAVEFQANVECNRLSLRIPWILTEPTYVEDLRYGAGFRCLRRISVACRLNAVIEECLDSILASLGPEELGKRGCGPKDLASLDADLKARFVTTEEQVHAVSYRFGRLRCKAVVSWWNRACDVGLIVGSFVHGLVKIPWYPNS